MDAGSVKTAIDGLRHVLRMGDLWHEGSEPFPCFGFDSETAFDIFVSRTIRYALNDDDSVDEWIRTKLADTLLEHELIPIAGIDKWSRQEVTGNLVHESGRFFTIRGLHVRHRTAHGEIEWDQPIIDQPEVGILGILAKKFNGVLHLCLQAKEEPGNINCVQLAPTVQATYSNYSKAHGGEMPPYLEFFLRPGRERVLFSKLQAEDGGRFLYKSNRNMIVMCDDDFEIRDNFIWLSLRQIGLLMERDNLINSCARSVLACLL